MRWFDGIIYLVDMSLSKLQEMVKGRKAWHAAVHEAAKSRTQLSDWTTTTSLLHCWGYEFRWTYIQSVKNKKTKELIFIFYRDLPFWPKLFCFSLKKLRENSKFFLEIQKHFFSPTNSLNFCLRKYLSLHHLCRIISLDTKLGFLDFRIFFFLDLDFRLFKAGF